MSLDAKILEESGHVPGTGERGERDHAPESEGTEMELEETIAAMIAVNTRGTDPGAETGNSSVYQQLRWRMPKHLFLNCFEKMP